MQADPTFAKLMSAIREKSLTLTYVLQASPQPLSKSETLTFLEGAMARQEDLLADVRLASEYLPFSDAERLNALYRDSQLQIASVRAYIGGQPAETLNADAVRIAVTLLASAHITWVTIIEIADARLRAYR